MKNAFHQAQLCQNELYKLESDHREIGKKQGLFSFHEEGAGFPFFHERGIVLKNLLIDYWRGLHKEKGYVEIESPLMLDKSLWERSGHWELYKENMYTSLVDKREYAIKPMNCPGAMLYYQEVRKSHKQLPLRVCELGRVHRNESSGALHGLFRARSFVVDDAHIFCKEDDLVDEIKSVLNLFLEVLNRCGFKEVHFELSLRSVDKRAKYLGEDSDWEIAEHSLRSSLKDLGLEYIEAYGEAKFYGPAIDVKIKDSQERLWQCSSLQMDFNLAPRFKLSYFDHNGVRKTPFILHRCVFGSLERFIGILLEHYQGQLPLWLCPVQVKILSVDSSCVEYAKKILTDLENEGLRIDLDLSKDNISTKIKNTIAQNIPYIVILGKKEIEQNRVTVRLMCGAQRSMIEPSTLISLLKSEIV